MRIAVISSTILTVTGCTTLPVTSDLYGLWSNFDSGTVRVLEFEATGEDADVDGLDDVYHIHLYPSGSDPAEVQRGTYEVIEDQLVWTVVWDIDGALANQQFSDAILGYGSDFLVLESATAASGERRFDAVSAFP